MRLFSIFIVYSVFKFKITDRKSKFVMTFYYFNRYTYWYKIRLLTLDYQHSPWTCYTHISHIADIFDNQYSWSKYLLPYFRMVNICFFLTAWRKKWELWLSFHRTIGFCCLSVSSDNNLAKWVAFLVTLGIAM